VITLVLERSEAMPRISFDLMSNRGGANDRVKGGLGLVVAVEQERAALCAP